MWKMWKTSHGQTASIAMLCLSYKLLFCLTPLAMIHSTWHMLFDMCNKQHLILYIAIYIELTQICKYLHKRKLIKKEVVLLTVNALRPCKRSQLYQDAINRPNYPAKQLIGLSMQQNICQMDIIVVVYKYSGLFV